MNELKEVIIHHSPQILSGILILFVSVGIACVIRWSLLKILRGLARESGMDRFVAGVFYYSILILGILTGFNTMGVKMGPLIAGLGLGGFALGFALRDALSNLLAGVMILLFQPFRIGEVLTVAGCEGDVCEINLRYTLLRGTEDTIMIPNSIIFTNPLRVKIQKKDNDVH